MGLDGYMTPWLVARFQFLFDLAEFEEDQFFTEDNFWASVQKEFKQSLRDTA